MTSFNKYDRILSKDGDSVVKKLTAFGTVSFFISAALKTALAITNIVISEQNRDNYISPAAGAEAASAGYFGAADMFLGAVICILFAAFLMSKKKALAVTGSLTAVFAYGLFMRYSALYRHSVSMWIATGEPVNMWTTNALTQQIGLAILYTAMFITLLILAVSKDKMPGAVKVLAASIPVVVYLPLSVMSAVTGTETFLSGSASLFSSLVFIAKILNLLFFLIALICLLVNLVSAEKTDTYSYATVIPKQKPRVPEAKKGPYIPPSQISSSQKGNGTGSLM